MLKTSAEDIKWQVLEAPEIGNKLSIQVNTAGVTAYWDYILDKQFRDRIFLYRNTS